MSSWVHCFGSIAAGVEGAPRTPGRDGVPSPAEHGFLHCGPSGAGHFVKMVHNGIEYGIMAAYAEGLSILRGADAGLHRRQADAETAPLENPGTTGTRSIRPTSPRCGAAAA